MFWNGSTAIDGLSGTAGACRRARSGPVDQHAIDAYQAGNVFDLLFARILEREVKLITHLVVHDPAHTDPPQGSASASRRAAMLTPSP